MKISGLILTIGVAMTSPALAAFNDNGSHHMLSAEVGSFCEIGSAPVGEVSLQDGMANLGVVQETCNAANGYIVEVRFDNVDEAIVDAGSEQVAIADGRALLTYHQAQRQQRQWQIRDAVLDQPQAPVVMYLSISPL